MEKKQKWNPYLLLSFLKKQGTFHVCDIYQRVDQRLECWMKDDFIALVTNTMVEALQNVGPDDKPILLQKLKYSIYFSSVVVFMKQSATNLLVDALP